MPPWRPAGTPKRLLTDTGERVSHEHVHDPAAAECRVEQDEPGRVGADLAHVGSVRAERMRAEGGERGFRRLGGDDRDEPALASRRRAGRCRGSRTPRRRRAATGSASSSRRHGKLRLGGELVERGGERHRGSGRASSAARGRGRAARPRARARAPCRSRGRPRARARRGRS